jgi:DNA-binding transcriptional MerR regulator
MNERDENEIAPGTLHTIETVVHLTGVPRGEVVVYWKSGLLSPATVEGEENALFDDEAIYLIRRIEHLRAEQGINLAGIRMIFELMNEVRQLQEEMRFFRS